MLQEERKRMLRLETSTFITRFRHLKGPKGHRTFLVLTLQHGNSVGCNFTQSPFMQWNHRKSRYKNLWEFQENSQLLSSVAKLSNCGFHMHWKLCHLRFFLSQFFSLHVVWTQQLLHQIKLNSLESLQNYAHKNSWANPVCMKTFPTTFARLTVNHFTPMATLWTGPLWHSSWYTEIHLHIIIFFGRYEIVGPHNKYLSKPMNSW